MKYIQRVLLENFQSHARSELTFAPGLNVITGPSDNGKSAILRAIRWALYNQPRGTDFVRSGSRECKVEVTMSDGAAIRREVSLTKSGTTARHRYVITLPGGEPQVFEAFGTDLPPEAIQAHGMAEVVLDTDKRVVLNFGSQLEGPFLLAETGSVRARAIGRLLGVHVVDAAIRETQREARAHKQEIGRQEARLARLEQELAPYADLPGQEADLAAALHLLDQADLIFARLEGLQRMAAELRLTTERMEAERALLSSSRAAVAACADEYAVLLKRSGRCPTCFQPLADEAVARLVANLTAGEPESHAHSGGSAVPRGGWPLEQEAPARPDGAGSPDEAASEARLHELKRAMEAARQETYRYLARLEELERSQERLRADLMALGLTPAELEAELAQLRAETDDLLTAAAARLGLAPAQPAEAGAGATAQAGAPAGAAPGAPTALTAPALRAHIRRAQTALAQRKGQEQRIRQDQAECQAELERYQEESRLFAEVALLLQQTADHARSQARERIESLVSSTLQAVFGAEYSFAIELAEKAGRPEAEFYVVSTVGGESLKTRPQDARGGGVVDIVALGLRIAMLETYRPHLAGALILDEPAKHVSEEYIESAARFFRTVSDGFGRQVIMVTHNSHLAETADRAYQVVLRDESSRVTRTV